MQQTKVFNNQQFFKKFFQMIQNFQEEACFILDTMKGNKTVRQISFCKELKNFFQAGGIAQW
jgi:hypothetical protein